MDAGRTEVTIEGWGSSGGDLDRRMNAIPAAPREC